MAVGLLLRDLQVRHRGLQLAVPVDQPLVAVDQTLLMEIDEGLDDGARQPLVHGEAFPSPVGRRAEAAELAGDGIARFLLPLPDPLDESLAAEFAARRAAVLGQFALDHHLRRDAGMIGARLPQRIPALHARIADQDVLQGEVQRMAHVQAAGDIGRRHHDGEGVAGGIPAGGESAGGFPGRIMLCLDLSGPIGLVQHR